MTGSRLYSSNHLSQKVKQYAQEVTQEHISQYDGIQLRIPFAEASVEIYEPTSKEILLFDDAIGVKRQKEKRQKDYKKTIKTVQTDVIEVQTPQGGYEYITGGYGVKDWDIEVAIRCWFCFHYGRQLLPIVAITDGASKIRERLWRIFGQQVVIILDWFHLHKKSKELLSMIAWNKKQKEEILAYIMPLLWEGKTNEVLSHLKKIQARNQEKKEEFIAYLQKHKFEIIDYKRRKEANKPIGSGRAEKGVDLVVAQRQKNRPIAWSEHGSHALSVLKADEINHRMAA